MPKVFASRLRVDAETEREPITPVTALTTSNYRKRDEFKEEVGSADRMHA